MRLPGWMVKEMVFCFRSKALMFVFLLLIAATAHADATQEAKNHYRKGTAAYALGRYSEAAGEYEAAFELAPDPALLYNAAQAHRVAGEKQRALTLYQNYVRVYGSEASNVDDVKRIIAELKRSIESDTKATAKPTAPAEPASTVTRPATTRVDNTTPPASQLTATAPESKKTQRRSPWLWIGIGAGALVVAGVAVGLGIAFGKSNPSAPSFGTVTY
jgi:tetratricopeptide (TPR) repeat protein